MPINVYFSERLVPMLKHNYYGNCGKETFSNLPLVLQRFLSYTQYDTTSDPASTTAPSTEAQMAYAHLLKAEFESVGLTDVRVTDKGIVMATLPASVGLEELPAMGLIAHMDTSPEASGKPAQWKVLDYQGGDIVLNETQNIVMSLERFPGVAKYAGEQLVVTDGTTLLGADDKAGIAIIVETARYFVEHPEVPHAKLCFAVTPDEEVGRGTENFDIKAFGADYAYTFDGDELGGFETETFNAAMVKVHFEGLNVHPGSAKNKMINAIRMAMDFIDRLPAESTPEKTEGHEGFFHPIDITGSVQRADLRMLIRDHSNERFEDRIRYVEKVVCDMNADWGSNRVNADITEQYRNLKNYLDRHPAVCDLAREAYKRIGVEIREKPVRGGTDGARLSAMGLPTPNLFTGGMNYHGVYECLSVTGLSKALDLGIMLGKMSAEVKALD